MTCSSSGLTGKTPWRISSNTGHPYIRLTMKLEEEKKLLFFDVLVSREAGKTEIIDTRERRRAQPASASGTDTLYQRVLRQSRQNPTASQYQNDCHATKESYDPSRAKLKWRTPVYTRSPVETATPYTSGKQNGRSGPNWRSRRLPEDSQNPISLPWPSSWGGSPNRLQLGEDTCNREGELMREGYLVTFHTVKNNSTIYFGLLVHYCVSNKSIWKWASRPKYTELYLNCVFKFVER